MLVGTLLSVGYLVSNVQRRLRRYYMVLED